MFEKVAAVALSLVSVFVPFTEANDNAELNLDTKTVLKLNQQSKSSMASSWLELPNSCKAKGFNADPIIVDRKKHSLEIIEIYNSLS